MLRADLAAADPPIPYRDAQGRVLDFHSLRVSYATNLARAGVPLAVAQRLLDHSSPAITSKFYTILETEDLAAEVRKLPPPPG
jgi:site-specific recombinase XerD